MGKEEIIKKYKDRIANELDDKKVSSPGPQLTSDDYKKFRREFMPRHFTLFEKLANTFGMIKIEIDKKRRDEMQRNINVCHLQTTPEAIISFSILGPVIFFVVGTLITYALWQSLFFLFYFLFMGLGLMQMIKKAPDYMANGWRLKASNQMVQCIFYIVTYMRHTSNLENAMEFATEHLTPPLSLDLKKVIWDVETGTYDSVKESLDKYLENWRDWNTEFVEAFHLVESSLYESSEVRRTQLVEKALDVMLTETYDKMLHYTHELKSPITMLHMLGVILPVLGLVILPMVTSFLTSDTMTPNRIALYIAVIYNVTLPLIVYIMGRNILTKRPTGYGDSDISAEFPELNKKKRILIKLGKKEVTINPIWIAVSIGVILFLIGFSPILYRWFNSQETILAEKPFLLGFFKMFGYELDRTGTFVLGPYGLGAALISLAIPLALGIGMGLYFSMKSKNVIKIREETKKLESEFASGLFQLGNRIGDGIPVEIAFQNVAGVMTDSRSGKFFGIVANNLRNLGVSVEDAIFDKKIGAIKAFPSNVIRSSMKVLIESAKKGPQICSRTVLTVAEYIKDIHRVNERLKDLMADIISSMKQQVSFMAPVISAVVIGITSMLVTILLILRKSMATLEGNTTQGGDLLSMFGDGVPTFFFQIIVGLYVVEIVYVLTTLVNGVENGSDKLSEDYMKGKALIRSTLLYSMLTFIVIIIFNVVAYSVLKGIGPGS